MKMVVQTDMNRLGPGQNLQSMLEQFSDFNTSSFDVARHTSQGSHAMSSAQNHSSLLLTYATFEQAGLCSHQFHCVCIWSHSCSRACTTLGFASNPFISCQKVSAGDATSMCCMCSLGREPDHSPGPTGENARGYSCARCSPGLWGRRSRCTLDVKGILTVPSGSGQWATLWPFFANMHVLCIMRRWCSHRRTRDCQMVMLNLACFMPSSRSARLSFSDCCIVVENL